MENFKKHGGIPFSPVMRAASIRYLNAMQKAEGALAKLYDKGIGYYTQKKNDDDGRLLIAEKKKTLGAKVVGASPSGVNRG